MEVVTGEVFFFQMSCGHNYKQKTAYLGYQCVDKDTPINEAKKLSTENKSSNIVLRPWNHRAIIGIFYLQTSGSKQRGQPSAGAFHKDQNKKCRNKMQDFQPPGQSYLQHEQSVILRPPLTIHIHS